MVAVEEDEHRILVRALTGLERLDRQRLAVKTAQEWTPLLCDGGTWLGTLLYSRLIIREPKAESAVDSGNSDTQSYLTLSMFRWTSKQRLCGMR